MGGAPCPSPCTETQHRAMHLDATPLPPFFYYFAFFLKTDEKICQEIKKKQNTHHVSLAKELNSWFHSHQLDKG